MANVVAIDHEEDVFPGDWGTGPGEWIYAGGSPELTDSQAIFLLEPPVGGPDPDYDLLATAIEISPSSAFGSGADHNRWGPEVTIASATEMYGSMWATATAQTTDAAGLSLISTERPAGAANSQMGEWVIYITTTTTGWKFQCANGTGTAGLGVGTKPTAGEYAFNEWHRIDWYFKTNSPDFGFTFIIASDDCVAATTISESLDLRYPITRLALNAPPTGTAGKLYIDNIVLNDTSGETDNTFPCSFSFPGHGFTGTDGGIVSPAPEALPHVITVQDVEGNRVLQRKLQENFESIQRQLLALDPDTPESSDPLDR